MTRVFFSSCARVVRVRRHMLLAATALLVVLVACLTSGCASTSNDASSTSADTQEAQTTQDAAETTVEGTTPLEQHGALHVEGTHIVDEHGDIFQLKGVSTHGLAWFPQYVGADSFMTWRDWGANTVRLALYTQESGGWCTTDDAGRQDLLDTLYAGIDAATQGGMYVIVDWHILSDGDPRTNQTSAETFFDTVSARYADQANVIYEVCNEPNGNTTWDDIRAYAADVIPHIRANSPDALVVVGTPTWSQDVDKVATDPVDDTNVAYALHFYAATHKQGLRDKAQEAIDAGTPLVVTEFGACEASGNGAVDTGSADEWVSFLDTNDIGYVCWNLSNKDEASSLLSASCTTTSGWSDSDLSAEGLWYKAILQGGAGAGTTADAPAASTTTVQSQAANMDGTLFATVERTNSWESDGRSYAQYSLTVTNGSSVQVSGWGASVTFSQDVELSDVWCADASVEGDTVRLTPAAYLSDIASGRTDSSIGLIVSSASDPQVVSVRVTS